MSLNNNNNQESTVITDDIKNEAEPNAKQNNNKLIAVIELTSSDSIDENFENIKNTVSDICVNHPKVCMIFLPENFAFLGGGSTGLKSSDIADTGNDGPLLSKYKLLCKKHSIWMSLGGFPILPSVSVDNDMNTERKKTFNTHLIINGNGEIVSEYQKIHLFDVCIPNGITVQESNATISGEKLVCCSSPIGTLGLSVCYDLRFPQMFTKLRNFGAQVLVIPAAFSFVTGADHWSVLLRARAIENQCFVIASAQSGNHNKKRKCWGKSCVVGPWGNVIAQSNFASTPKYFVASIDLDLVQKVRQAMPLQMHQKPSAYQFKVVNAKM